MPGWKTLSASGPALADLRFTRAEPVCPAKLMNPTQKRVELLQLDIHAGQAHVFHFAFVDEPPAFPERAGLSFGKAGHEVHR